MACDVPIKDKNTPWTSICHLTCKKDCPDMSCTAHLCYPDCQEDNCKLSCTGRGGDSQNPAECYPRCLGKKCTIHCKSLYCEAACEQGGCDIKFSKVTFGTVSCKENCTLTCAKGKNCRFIRACPNCKTFVVDDPFPPTNNTLPPTNNTLPVRPNNADGVSCEIKNCTSSPCDLKTCQNTAATCKQFCSASPCKTSCQSTAGCEAKCLSGNCTKMACDVPIKDKNTPRTSICHLTCKKDCPDMKCTAHSCYPTCQEDNCKLSCTGKGGDPRNPTDCYPRCLGKNCTIHCKSLYCEAACNQGGCDIKFSKTVSVAKLKIVHLHLVTSKHAKIQLQHANNFVQQVLAKRLASQPLAVRPNVYRPSTSICSLTCKKDCPDMNCMAHLCYPTCQEDNCKLSCTGKGGDPQRPPQCYPRCFGKNCTIHCKSPHCEAACDQGGAPKTCPDVEACLSRIKTHTGVLGVIVVNKDDIPVKTTLDNQTTQLYTEHCRQLSQLARHTVRDVDPTNDLTFLRIRSKKNEIVIAPDHGYTIITIQAGPRDAPHTDTRGT
eukprot:gene17737-19510_t